MDLYAGLTGLAALIAAAGVVWRFLWPRELLRWLREFLMDWRGEAARPGFEGIPSVPERLSKVERRTEDLNHQVLGEVSSSLHLVSAGIDELKDHATDQRAATRELEARVTDHRRRNEQQVELLRAEIDRRIQAVQDELLKRRSRDRETDD